MSHFDSIQLKLAWWVFIWQCAVWLVKESDGKGRFLTQAKKDLMGLGPWQLYFPDSTLTAAAWLQAKRDFTCIFDIEFNSNMLSRRGALGPGAFGPRPKCLCENILPLKQLKQ